MPALINLVGTRAVRSEHAALLRWYADHVHLLLAFDGLNGATLYRALEPDADVAPQYLCLYEFADADAFDGYERSALRVAIEQDRQRGWGRDGIEIIVRTPFHRHYRRRAGDAAVTRWQIQAWQSGGIESSELERSLAAAAGNGAFVLLRAAVQPPAWADFLTLSTAWDDRSLPPALRRRWQGAYDTVWDWQR